MKTHLLFVLVILGAAGLVSFFLLRTEPPKPSIAEPAAKAEKTDLSKSVATTEPKPVAAPARVAAPTLPAPPVLPDSAPAQIDATPRSETSPATEVFVAEPQADLKSAIATCAHFVETHDLVSLIKAAMPPTELQQMRETGKASTPEEVADVIRQQKPDIEQNLTQMLPAMKRIQDQIPELSEDGSRATYTLDPPVGNMKSIAFVKIDGNWYLK